MDIKERDIKSLFSELVKRVENSVVLKKGRDDVLTAFLLSEPCGADDSLIVSLASARGKGDLPRLTAEYFRNSFSRIGKSLVCTLSDRVQA